MNRDGHSRQEERRPISGLVGLVQRARVVLDEARTDIRQCRILDASDHGFRLAITNHRLIEIGSRLILEHEDGWRRRVRVCWRIGNEFGLQTIGAITFILDLAGENAEPCTIVAASETGYRITLETPRKIAGELTLELANRTRHRVRVRWMYGEEIALQIVEPPRVRR